MERALLSTGPTDPNIPFGGAQVFNSLDFNFFVLDGDSADEICAHITTFNMASFSISQYIEVARGLLQCARRLPYTTDVVLAKEQQFIRRFITGLKRPWVSAKLSLVQKLTELQIVSYCLQLE